MDSKKYIEFTATTDHKSYEDTAGRCGAPEASKLIHYTLGLVTEAAEVADLVKKYIAYNKDFTELKFKDEMADCLWYIARMCAHFDTSFEELMDINEAKLKARFGGKFTEAAAVTRNLHAEDVAMASAIKEQK